jgi:hypothetical protein
MARCTIKVMLGAIVVVAELLGVNVVLATLFCLRPFTRNCSRIL